MNHHGVQGPRRTQVGASELSFRCVSEPVLSRTSLYDRGLYPRRSLRRKPIMRKSSLWWAVRRLLKSWERIVHVAHPYSIASITSALKSLILSDSRAFRRSYSWELYFGHTTDSHCPRGGPKIPKTYKRRLWRQNTESSCRIG